MAQLHPAWAQLDEKLAWRRSACRIAEACSADEAAKGSVLKHIQSTRFCSLLPRAKGSLNSYLDALPELSAAVRAYMQADGGFYAQAPSENINYGGRGAGQQLWWKSSAQEWRVSQPDRLKLNPQPEGKPQSKRKQPASRGGFGPALDAGSDEDAIRDEDIHLLPPVEAEPAPLPLPAPAPMSWWGPWGGGSASTDELNGTPDSSVSTTTTDDGDLLTSSDEDGWAGAAAGYPDRPQTPPGPMPAEPAARHAPWLSAIDARMYGGAGGGGNGAAWGADAAYTAAEPAAKRYRSNSPNLSTAFFFGLSVIAIVHHSVYVPLERAESSRRALSSIESLSLHEASVALEDVFVCRQSSSRPAELVPWAGWPEQCPLGVLLMGRMLDTSHELAGPAFALVCLVKLLIILLTRTSLDATWNGLMHLVEERGLEPEKEGRGVCEQLFPDCTKAVMSTLIGTAMATVTPSDTTVFSTVVAGLLVLVTHKLARQNVSWHAPMVLLAFLRHFIAVNLAHAAVVRASRLT